jgi:hypothetical protein
MKKYKKCPFSGAIILLRHNPAKGGTKCEEIIIKEGRGMRTWRISADYTDYADLRSFLLHNIFYLRNPPKVYPPKVGGQVCG